MNYITNLPALLLEPSVIPNAMRDPSFFLLPPTADCRLFPILNSAPGTRTSALSFLVILSEAKYPSSKT